MSNDEIKPGDRFEAVDGWSLPMGTVFTASGPWGRYWAVSERTGLWDLENPALWRRLPRADAPAVKVGDIVRDPALLVAGMQVQVVGDGHYPWVYQDWLAGDPVTSGVIRRDGVRILALSEPPKAEAVEMLPLSPEKIQQAREALKAMQPSPPRCAPVCTPREPCLTEGVCPGWKEDAELHSAGSSDCPCAPCVWFRAQRGVSPDALPPARASTYQPRCAGLSGWGSWNGRAGK